MFERTYSFWRRLVGKAETSERRDEERRLWVRHPASLSTTVQPNANGKSLRVAARIRNVSRGGINLLAEHPFVAGQLITVELPLGNEKTQAVLACIVRVAEEAGQWALGCIFSHELAEEDLAGLGGKRVKHEASDQRTWMRFATAEISADFHMVGDIRNSKYTARVFNISASGVGLQVDERIEPGVLLSVDFMYRNESVRRSILACVVHVSPAETGEWSLGCNFIRSLSEQEVRGMLGA